MQYSVITPTILRPQLFKTCVSVRENCNAGDYVQHIVIVDKSYGKLLETDKTLLDRCMQLETSCYKVDIVFSNKRQKLNDSGNMARHLAYQYIDSNTTYVMLLDDDDELANNTFLRLTKFAVTAPPVFSYNAEEWDREAYTMPDVIVFPCLRDGSLFFHKPARSFHTVSCQYVFRPVIHGQKMQFPPDVGYTQDGAFLDMVMAAAKNVFYCEGDYLSIVKYISAGLDKVRTFDEYRRDELGQ